MARLVADLGSVDLDFECFTVSPILPGPWADGNSAEGSEQVGKIVEHRNPSQPNPGPRPDGPPCRVSVSSRKVDKLRFTSSTYDRDT